MLLKHLILPCTVLLSLISTGCQAAPAAAPTLAPTIALPVLVIPIASPPAIVSTQAPPSLTPAPTSVPVEGTTTTQLNVRAEPSTSGATLGMVGPFVKVQILAKDAGGNWYQIVYAQAPEGKGWITAAYVQAAEADRIPAMGGTAADPQGPSGVILQQVNVRSGPGTSFDSLGTLNPQDNVTLTGKNADGTWLQIAFSAGPQGQGWVTAAFIQTSEAAGLPILGEQGELIGTGTPAAIPPAPTATVLPAFNDADSAEAPSLNVRFSPSGTGSLQFSSGLSAPEGDPQDWVGFTPYLARLSIRLECAGSQDIQVELLQNDQPAQGWEGLACGGQELITVTPGSAYLVHLTLPPGNDGLEYSYFTIHITSSG